MNEVECVSIKREVPVTSNCNLWLLQKFAADLNFKLADSGVATHLRSREKSICSIVNMILFPVLKAFSKLVEIGQSYCHESGGTIHT